MSEGLSDRIEYPCGCYRRVERDKNGEVTDIAERFCRTHWQQIWDQATPDQHPRFQRKDDAQQEATSHE